ncbi:MAG: hypothetical protein ACYC2H_04430 [Thermoplasmatota archaeon]
MTRFINTVLITVFAFFVILGVFWQFAGGGTGAGERGDPTVTAISPSWQPAAAQEMLVELTVHNPAGQEGRIASVTYEAIVDGDVVDKAVARVPPGPAVIVPPKAEAVVHVPVDLPEDFVLTWWPTYMEDGEAAELSIRGTVALRRDDGLHDAGFEWRSKWTGELAERLTAAVRNCEAQPNDLCLASSQFFWKEGTLHASLSLHNPGPDAIAVRNSTVRLLFGDEVVVSGKVDFVRELDPGSDTDVELALSFSQKAIAAWWPDHLERCERTPLELGMTLQAHSLPNGTEGPGAVTTLQWTFPAPPFQTRFVCDP